jgi:hypothetical protein
MDAHHASLIVSMLHEIGIEVTAEALEPDTMPPADLDYAPSSPSYVPPSPTLSAQDEAPIQLPSFVQLTHVQPERSRVPYKRITHFAAHLAQLCGRMDCSRLPKGIVRRLRRSGVKPTEPAAYFRCRRLLKRWGFSSPEYRCIFSILKQMGGPVLRLSYAQETALRNDFARLCALFDRQQPLGERRKNFISYYLITQLLLKKYRIATHYILPSIKDRHKFAGLVDAYCTITQAQQSQESEVASASP